MDDITINKLAIIERYLIRINTEYNNTTSDFSGDFTRQDSVILNIDIVKNIAEKHIEDFVDFKTSILKYLK